MTFISAPKPGTNTKTTGGVIHFIWNENYIRYDVVWHRD